MHGGIIDTDELNVCKCGCTKPHIVWYYISGIANHINYFAKCENCKTRTRDRDNIQGAIKDWNNKISL
jgi:hypothetical protein